MKKSLVHKCCPWILIVLAAATGASTAATSRKGPQQMIGQDHLGPYSEVSDPVAKTSINSQIDNAARSLSALATGGASRNELLSELNSRINSIDRNDLSTEDAESVASAFEAMLDPSGLDSSDGILNTWLYGFDPQ